MAENRLSLDERRATALASLALPRRARRTKRSTECRARTSGLEARSALSVEAHDLALEHRTGVKLSVDDQRQVRERASTAVARDELGLAAEEEQRAKAVSPKGSTSTAITPADRPLRRRRGGKSWIAATVAIYLACLRDYARSLAPGERVTRKIAMAVKIRAKKPLGFRPT
jgi:hypothetical protein